MVLLRRKKCNFINKIVKISIHIYNNIFKKNGGGGGAIDPKSNHSFVHAHNSIAPYLYFSSSYLAPLGNVFLFFMPPCHHVFSSSCHHATTAVELKSYNAILAPLIYQKNSTAVEAKQNFFADVLQCTSIYRCALQHSSKKKYNFFNQTFY